VEKSGPFGGCGFPQLVTAGKADRFAVLINDDGVAEVVVAPLMAAVQYQPFVA
jgi:hypothetical protein